MNYKASNFKLNQSVKVYTLDTQSYIIEIRATKRKVDNEITYRLDVFALGLDLTVENVYAQSLFSPGGTLFNCDEEVNECIVLYIIGLMKDHKVYVNLANIRKQLDFIKLDVSDEFIYKCMRLEYTTKPSTNVSY